MTPTEDHGGVEATARAIVENLLEVANAMGVYVLGDTRQRPDAIKMYDAMKAAEAWLAGPAAAIRAAPPSGLTPPRPDVSSGAPAAGSREAIDALRECIGRVRDRLTKFRYRTGPCPFCRSTVHAADCALIPIMDDTAAALVASEQEAK